MFVEPLITKGKNDTTHSRRTVFAALRSKYAVKELFGAVIEKVGQRPGGYTRILKTGFRHGDSAEMAVIELTDYNETYTQSKGTAERKRTRRRGKKASGDVVAVGGAAAESVVEPASSSDNDKQE